MLPNFIMIRKLPLLIKFIDFSLSFGLDLLQFKSRTKIAYQLLNKTKIFTKLANSCFENSNFFRTPIFLVKISKKIEEKTEGQSWP